MVFEDECRRHAQRLVDAGALPGRTVGRWWGAPRDPQTRRAVPTELDVVALGEGRTFEVVGEVKWSGRDLRPVLSQLDAKVARLPEADGAQRVLWSATAPDPRSRPTGITAFNADNVVFG
jgi:hypothetical protein